MSMISLIGLFGPIITIILMVIIIFKSYKNMRSKEKVIFTNVSKIPTIMYRKWYAIIIPISGLLGALLFNILSLSDPQRGIFDNIRYSSIETLCIFAIIGIYIISVLLTGILFVLRLIVYNNEKMLILFVFSIPIGLVLFPVYYIYNFVCLITKKRTTLN